MGGDRNQGVVMNIPNEDGNFLKPHESKSGRTTAMIICWLFGNGILFPWNSVLAAQDYYLTLFPRYHPTRVLTMVYSPVSFATTVLLAYTEATINTRKRNLTGYTLFFLTCLSLPILDLATFGNGGIWTYIGVIVIVGVSGVAGGHVEGGMVGDLSLMCPEFIQSLLAGLAGSGALTSLLRIITKAAFKNSKNGLRKGAITFLAISSLFELLCVILYAFVFAKLPIVKYYRSKAASEGSKTVTADLAASGVEIQQSNTANHDQGRLNKRQLFLQNIDYAVSTFLVYLLTQSIFPGFLAEDTGKHSLGSWYPVVLIAMFNFLDLAGRYIPIIGCLKLESRKGIVIATLSRFLFVPAFYFTVKYGDQGWMIFLTSFLGLSNGYLSVCIFTTAPQGYKGPEQNALGVLLTMSLLGGILVGVSVDWLWLIGKGW